MEFIIVTGLSGSGKSRAVNALEDIGFFCVDNVPPSFIARFRDLCVEERMEKVAVVTDVRGRELFKGLNQVLDILKNGKVDYKILFFECSDDVLVNRYKETRRKHPLAGEGDVDSIQKAVKKERALLEPLRERADYIIDTTYSSPAQLKERIAEIFLGNSVKGMKIICMSFGFKYGAPSESDLVFDVRCFPNPFYERKLRELTGKDKAVFEYVMEKPEAEGFSKRLIDLMDYMIPLYSDEGKSSLVVAFGCTGGKHRSVAFAEFLNDHFVSQGLNSAVMHRDILRVVGG